MSGDRLLAYAPGIRRVYAEAFGAPPWREDPARADAYLERLAADTARPGCTAACAFAAGDPAAEEDGDEKTGGGEAADAVVGFAVAWTTPTPFPGGRRYRQVAEALGADRAARWLCGAREVDELAVGARARGTGAGAALLDAVTTGAAGGRCWLLTSARAGHAVRFYRRRGWRQVAHLPPYAAGPVVFLGPRHPAATAPCGPPGPKPEPGPGP